MRRNVAFAPYSLLLPHGGKLASARDPIEKPIAGQRCLVNQSLVNFKKHATSMINFKPEPAIWSRNTSQRIASSISCQLTIACMEVYDNGAIIFQGIGERTYVRSVMRLSRAGVPLSYSTPGVLH